MTNNTKCRDLNEPDHNVHKFIDAINIVYDKFLSWSAAALHSSQVQQKRKNKKEQNINRY